MRHRPQPHERPTWQPHGPRDCAPTGRGRSRRSAKPGHNPSNHPAGTGPECRCFRSGGEGRLRLRYRWRATGLRQRAVLRLRRVRSWPWRWQLAASLPALPRSAPSIADRSPTATTDREARLSRPARQGSVMRRSCRRFASPVPHPAWEPGRKQRARGPRLLPAATDDQPT